MIPSFKKPKKKKPSPPLTPSQKLRLKILELHKVRGSLLTPESYYEFKIDLYIDEIQREIDKITGLTL